MPRTKQIKAKAVDREIDRVLDGIKSLDDESRSYLRPMLREDVLESMLPGEAVLEHIRSRHEIVRDYVFPEGSGDDEAMFLLQYQVLVGEDFLESFAANENPPCEHFPQLTSGPSPTEMLTIKDQAADALKIIAEQELKSAHPSESTPQIEAAVEDFVARFAGALNEEKRKAVADVYRDTILNTTDPRMVIRRRLSRYETEKGVIDIPLEERLDRALKLLLVRFDVVSTALKLIATHDLSCGDHHVVYAGGVESEGNRIYTAQKVAKDSLEDLKARYLLEHLPVKDLLRKILASLTSEPN